MKNIVYIYTIIFVCISVSCKKDLAPINGCTDITATNYNANAIIDNGSCIYFLTTPYTIQIPEGFPDMIIPENNPMTVEGVSLGEKLFKDPILSVNNTQACIDCHKQSSAFSDPNQFSIGVDNMQGTRQASALINLGWNNSFNWDGSALTLEEQAFEPVVNPIEMHNTWRNVEETLNNHNQYPTLFKEVFNIDYIDSTHIVMAIAQFERTLISANSKFDKYLRGETQLTPSELEMAFPIYTPANNLTFLALPMPVWNRAIILVWLFCDFI